jgi:hypothetical protein
MGLGFLTLLSLLWLSCSCLADEILFQDQKDRQIGTILNEDEQSVTIRFSRESIKSITRNEEGMSTAMPAKVIWEEKGDYVVLTIPRQAIQIQSSGTQASANAPTPVSAAGGALPTQEKTIVPEKSSSDAEPARVPQTSEASKDLTAHQKLLQEEMGGVQGVIVWQGKPLDNGKVMIALETYTGFSISAIKSMLKGNKEKSTVQEVSFETHTDPQGRYSFSKVPPGYYRMYWQPDPQTGWVRRLRENPDFEVISGNVIVQDIPEKKK